MISILIPTRNEAANIGNALGQAGKAMEEAGLDYEILVIDDASNDGTVETVKNAMETNKKIRLIQRQPPYGFGYSLRDGIKIAGGEACVILMADLSDDPALLPKMKEELDKGADMVIGSRFVKNAKLANYPLKKMISNRLFNLAVQVGLFSRVTDSSNAFKMFRTGLARKLNLQSRGFEISAELTAKFIINKHKITEIPASWRDREGGEAKFKLDRESARYFSLWLGLLKEAYLKNKQKIIK